MQRRYLDLLRVALGRVVMGVVMGVAGQGWLPPGWVSQSWAGSVQIPMPVSMPPAPATPSAPATPLPLGYALITPSPSSPTASRSTAVTTAVTTAQAMAVRYGNKSLSRQPHAVARVHVEGTLPHEGIYDDSLEAKRDWWNARDLAVAGYLTGDSRYSDAAEALLAAWLAVYGVSLNPIDETDMDGLMIAYDLLPASARARLSDGMGRYLKAMAVGYLRAAEQNHFQAFKGGSAINNWQSHRVKLATLAAFALQDAALIARARAAFVAQLGDNIRQDGSTLDFEQRDAVHYVTFDLEPLCLAALAAKTHGEDWYHLTGASGVGLAAALDWLQPYADGSKSHEEFVHSSVKFDAIRANAGIKGFNGPFDPKVAAGVYAYASHLDRRYGDLAKALGSPAWVTVLLP